MISLTSARDFSNLTIKKAAQTFLTAQPESNDVLSTQQESNEQIDEITPEQLALLSTQAHAWLTIISDKPLSKHALLKVGVDINKIINITHEQISANRINALQKSNQSYVVMLQKNQSRQLAQPFYSQLVQQCEEQNLRLLSLTQEQVKYGESPVQLSLMDFEMQVA